MIMILATKLATKGVSFLQLAAQIKIQRGKLQLGKALIRTMCHQVSKGSEVSECLMCLIMVRIGRQRSWEEM